MNISFENPDKVNGLMTITVEEADFKENLEKQLKDYRKRINYPGFRPGTVPMSLVKRQVGTSLKMEVINKLVGEKLYDYIKENNIKMLGEPLPSDKQEPVDLEKDAPYAFAFDIAVAPDFAITLDGKDKINYYTIEVDDKQIDREVEMYASRMGHYDKVETYEKNDMLKGDLRELDAEGNTLEGGITVADAVMLPDYIKNEDQKALFDNTKLGDIIVFNPREAYPDNDSEVSALLKIKREEVAEHTGNFSYQVTEISRYVKHPVDQELFNQVYGEGNVTDEKQFRERVAEDLKAQFAIESDYRFQLDLREYVEKKVGTLTFPDALLKRIMLNNNKDKGEEYVEQNYEGSIKQLAWHLAKEQLVEANGVKIDDSDIKAAAKEAARAQFAQYGMNNVPDEYLDNYVADLLKKEENVSNFIDRAIDSKLIEALKKVVKLNEKQVSIEEFNKLFEKK